MKFLKRGVLKAVLALIKELAVSAKQSAGYFDSVQKDRLLGMNQWHFFPAAG